MEQEERFEKAVQVTGVGLLVNLGLTLFKLFAGILGNSAAMVADAVHSLSDFLTDIVVIFGFKVAKKPVDKSHNYGHGKIETLSASLVGLMLFVVAGEILLYGLRRTLLFAQGGALEQPALIALYAALLSVLSKEFMYHYTILQARKINSMALTANAWHHRSDALSSLCTLAGIGAAIFLGGKWVVLDPLMAVFLSFIILNVALKIFRSSINELIEASLDEETEGQIREIIRNTEGVKALSNLKTRRIGNNIAVDIRIKVDNALDIGEANRISIHVEHNLKKTFGPYTYVLVKAEPYEREPAGNPEDGKIPEHPILSEKHDICLRKQPIKKGKNNRL
ncbi:Cobalt-zinc-cadmium resistance protein [Methanosarcina siciliae C2J]|uniref:Cobalt-zinc-cadmium resistance protein n=3 Tax=Methanosarcina siciliae TaxID=38027 RepID=A0A0E3PEZ5_9EURY|nr:cation diffusion facilitator family transporter [Methanosarcina siciliae]AKB28979.1 Cobalt-zinc-cadmium resistance protein [Methanosarcina siciliae T4/M]AKB32857.1 Cobalt-zinc-cadmium resistance protein [Methanosarcina siciliae HI350]AKB37173.1 Cobalt-zinc-cadmium resistance protein [Methanosarcina siciliae C2J]